VLLERRVPLERQPDEEEWWARVLRARWARRLGEVLLRRALARLREPLVLRRDAGEWSELELQDAVRRQRWAREWQVQEQQVQRRWAPEPWAWESEWSVQRWRLERR
jgi:hypothetical protein